MIKQKCHYCLGHGFIYWEFRLTDGTPLKEYNHISECPICIGTGIWEH